MTENTNISLSVETVANEAYDEENICWAARYEPKSLKLFLTKVDCNLEKRILCFQFPLGLPTCKNSLSEQSLPKNLDLFLNNRSSDYEKVLSKEKMQIEDAYERINLKVSYQSFISTLWDSAMPCFDLKGITSNVDGENSILKSCSWRGKQLACSSIFTKVVTEQGLCCAFNAALADQVFIGTSLSSLITNLQKKDSSFAFENNSNPNSFFKGSEPKSVSGIGKGLTLVLDAHTDLLSASSVAEDFKGFVGLISGKGDFPMVKSKGFFIRPGHVNYVSLTATMIEAKQDLRSLEPWRRKCIFSDETQNLTLHRKYTQANCQMECALRYAQSETVKQFNSSCTPWYFPANDSNPTICDPWVTKFFVNKTFSSPEEECPNCLPSCSMTHYHQSISSSPFRRCDDLNLGVSKLCNLNDKQLSDPKIWATQIKNEYGENPPNYIDEIVDSQRIYLPKIRSMFSNMQTEYDAYEEDIAIVSVFFESSSVFLYGSQHSQTWIDFFSAVGGLMGLCFGFSFITIIELIWLCIHIGKLTMGEGPGKKN